VRARRRGGAQIEEPSREFRLRKGLGGFERNGGGGGGGESEVQGETSLLTLEKKGLGKTASVFRAGKGGRPLIKRTLARPKKLFSKRQL